MTNRYDVLILGSGLGGAITASILAQQGWKVLLIEAGCHPRFAVGEATTPDISCRLKIMAQKYSVPELDHLTTFHKLRDFVSPACGIKKSFSFLYHEEGQPQDPLQSHQFPTLAPPLGPDCHFFRQDTDSYMLGVALQYGAEVRQRTRISACRSEDDGVVLESETGEVFLGRYLVDASGFRSPIAHQFDLRETPSSLQARSRAIFTHMIGVKDYDALGPDFQACGLKYPFMEGTLHHVFKGGWMWLIPFNNHPESTNPLCSVGLMLDLEEFPENALAPQDEFFEIIGRFPSIAAQFEGASAVREWVGTPRLQYSSKTIIGKRFCLMAHAGGFIDPLFSTGLNTTLTVIDDLIPELNQALMENQFAPKRFEKVASQFATNLRHYDAFVTNAYRSFSNFDLWDAWFRVWVAGNFVATALKTNLYFNYLGSKDKAWFKKEESPPYCGVLGSAFEPHSRLFEEANGFMQSYAQGAVSASEAADQIRGLFEKATYLPKYFNWHLKTQRTTPTFTIPDATKMFLWYAFRAPKAIRKDLMSWSLMGAYGYTWRSIRDHRRRVKTRRKGFFRDTFFVKSKRA